MDAAKAIPAAEERRLRADARRNRARILAAARACFAEQGLEAQMDDVARRADVGVGTLYRHFPDKCALIDALTVERYRILADIVAEELERDDPWEAFERFVRRVAELADDDLAHCQLMGSRPQRESEEYAELQRRCAELVDRCHRAGVIREDFTAADFGLLFCGLGRVIERGREVAPAAWRRHLEFMLDGIRARPAATPAR